MKYSINISHRFIIFNYRNVLLEFMKNCIAFYKLRAIHAVKIIAYINLYTVISI